jgi:hypothetical protein
MKQSSMFDDAAGGPTQRQLDEQDEQEWQKFLARRKADANLKPYLFVHQASRREAIIYANTERRARQYAKRDGWNAKFVGIASGHKPNAIVMATLRD